MRSSSKELLAQMMCFKAVTLGNQVYLQRTTSIYISCNTIKWASPPSAAHSMQLLLLTRKTVTFEHCGAGLPNPILFRVECCCFVGIVSPAVSAGRALATNTCFRWFAPVHVCGRGVATQDITRHKYDTVLLNTDMYSAVISST